MIGGGNVSVEMVSKKKCLLVKSAVLAWLGMAWTKNTLGGNALRDMGV